MNNAQKKGLFHIYVLLLHCMVFAVKSCGIYLYQKSEIKTVIFSSVQFKMLSMHSEKPIYAPPPVSQKLPQHCLAMLSLHEFSY